MNRVPVELAFWREFHHPQEQRFWRCRPTPNGVEVQFRDEGDPEWSGRVRAFVPPKEVPSKAPQRIETHLGSFTSEDISPFFQYARRMEAAALEALPLVQEQLDDGFVEVSRDEGEQFWELCAELWRFESKDVALVSRLLERLAAVPPEARVAVGRALTQRASRRSTTTLAARADLAPAFWPTSYTDEQREHAQRALTIPREHTVLLLLALRLHVGPIAEDAMRALAAIGTDDALGFAVLYDLLIHPGLYDALPYRALLAFARTLTPLPERSAAILAFGEDAPSALGVRNAVSEHHFQRGCNAFTILASWAHDDVAAEAFYSARSVSSKGHVIDAAEVRPDRRWLDTLRRERESAPQEPAWLERYDAAIAACAACPE